MDAVEDRFWRALEERFPNLVEAYAVFAPGADRVSFAHFSRALDEWGEGGPDLLPNERQIVFGSLRRGHGEDWFTEGDMVREHSGWRKRTQALERSVMDAEAHGFGSSRRPETRDDKTARQSDSAATERDERERGPPPGARGPLSSASGIIIIPEPDALAKANDVRIPHQLLQRSARQPSPGKNDKWYYPQPSPEMEARRVIDFWRGLAARPWGSKQEAAQHFRRAFAFFDTVGCGRVNYDAFRAGLVRLRYGLPDALARLGVE